MALEDRHHQAERLGGGEHQRGQPQAAAHPVAAIETADRLDRQVRLPQGRDVPPGGRSVTPSLSASRWAVMPGLLWMSSRATSARAARDGRAPSLRRLLIAIEEYARHVGHADLIRESVDGLVGEDPPGDHH